MRLFIIGVCTWIFFCVSINSGYAQCVKVPENTVKKAYDINKDEKVDIKYSSDDKSSGMITADTNFDGKPDMVIHVKDGKFDSAEADTDYDGTMEKKFSDVAQFNQWLNESHPDFNDALSHADGTFEIWKF